VGHGNHVFREARRMNLLQEAIQVAYIYYISIGKIPTWNPSKLRTAAEGYEVSEQLNGKYLDN
jgi:hypothetical protein